MDEQAHSNASRVGPMTGSPKYDHIISEVEETESGQLGPILK